MKREECASQYALPRKVPQFNPTEQKDTAAQAAGRIQRAILLPLPVDIVGFGTSSRWSGVYPYLYPSDEFLPAQTVLTQHIPQVSPHAIL